MATSDDDDKDRDRDPGPDDQSPPDDAAGAAPEDDEASAPKAAEKPAGTAMAPGTKPPAAKAAVAPKAAAPRPPPTAGLGKSVTLFVVVVGGLSLLMLLLGTERGVRGPAAPNWKDGQTVEVDITLVSTDRQDLACASGTEIKGLHCQFESQAKRWSKSDPNDEKKQLRPYSTTNSVNFFAAGLWSEPALAPDKLPATRFAVKCKLSIAGKMPRADVRWHEGEGWNNVTDWWAGTVSDCKLSSVQN